MTTRSLHPAHVLAAFLEPIAVGRRVVVLGDATLGLAEELVARGARLVHAYDPDAARVAEALAKSAGGGVKTPAFAVLGADLGVRDGAFDIVVVPDLGAFADPGDVLVTARKLVGQGVAVVASPNAAATRRLVAPRSPAKNKLGYYELYDAVSLQFARVRMFGQAPFVGYTMADFAPEGEPEVSVDTSLLETSEEPEMFVAVASEHEVSVDAYAVVALPFEGVASELSEEREADTVRGLDRVALAEAQARIALMTAEIETMRLRALDDARELDVRAGKEAAMGARAVELEVALEASDARWEELENALEATAVRCKDAEGRAKDAEARVKDAEGRAKDAEGRIKDAEARVKDAEARVKDAERRADDSDARARAHEAKAAEHAAKAGDVHVRGERLAQQLRDLEDELRQTRERNVAFTKQLDDEKRARAKAEADVGTRGTAEVAAAKERIAALKYELEGTRSRIAELEFDQAQTMRPAPPDPMRIELEASLATARRASTSADAAREAAEAHARALAADLDRARGETRAAIARGDGADAKHADLETRRAQAAEAHAKSQVELALAHGKVVTLEAKLTELALRPPKVVDASDGGADIATLERALVERGRRIRVLERDMRETERVGRELLEQLAEAREGAEPPPPPPGPAHAGHVRHAAAVSTPGSLTNGAAALPVAAVVEAPPPSLRSPVDAIEDGVLRATLDDLAVTAARAEADLTAASWRIAQLERELVQAHAGARSEETVHAELEQALLAAHAEVAQLRKALDVHAS